jgi:hypothetical protein
VDAGRVREAGLVEARSRPPGRGIGFAYETYPTPEALASETDVVTGELTHHEPPPVRVYDPIGQILPLTEGS